MMPTHTGEDNPFYSVYQSNLISSRNTLTGTPRNNILPVIWTSCSPAMLTHKINHNTLLQKSSELVLAGVAQWIEYQPACEPKGRQINSQSGHMPGLWARSPVEGIWEATNQCISHRLMFLSFSIPFPSPLFKSKKIKSFLKNQTHQSGKGKKILCTSSRKWGWKGKY